MGFRARWGSRRRGGGEDGGRDESGGCGHDGDGQDGGGGHEDRHGGQEVNSACLRYVAGVHTAAAWRARCRARQLRAGKDLAGKWG